MATKKMLMQTIGGKSAGFLIVDASAGDLAVIVGLMEGKVEQYDSKGSGGTAAPMPSVLNRKKFSCGKKDSGFRCSFTVPHLKTTKNNKDVETAVIGAFDAHWEVSTTADYCNTLLAK